jgi:hypothetical protein
MNGEGIHQYHYNLKQGELSVLRTVSSTAPIQLHVVGIPICDMNAVCSHQNNDNIKQAYLS